MHEITLPPHARTPRHARTPFRGRFLGVLTIAAAVLAPALATATASAQSLVRLSSTPLTIEDLGLTLFLPVDASAQRVSWGGPTAAATKVDFPNESGFVAIHGKRSSDADLTLQQTADDLIEQLEASAARIGADGRAIPGTTRARLISREDNVEVADQVGVRFYMAIPSATGTDEVRGYTIFSPEPQRFVLFELFTDSKRFKDARVAAETMISSARFSETSDQDIKRAAMIEAGEKLVRSLTTEDFRDVFTNFGTRWERLYAPSRSGEESQDQEHGYRRIRAWIGRRGELEPDKPEAKWSDLEREPGYLIRIDARLLETGMVIDSRGLYFLSIDKSAEAWSLRMAIRQEGAPKPSQWSELGAREGEQLVVRVEQDSASPRVIKPIMQGAGYVSMVESHMLPQLLVHAGIPSDFAFYAYQSQAETVTLRTDSVSMPRGDGSVVEITTRPRENGPSQTARYRDDGSMISIERPDGRVWEPTEYKRLITLWKSKGLPLD